MIQLQILSGKRAGSEIAVRRFPFLIGRNPEADLRLDDAGVWDRHLQIDLQRGDGFKCRPQTDALTLINSEPVQEVLLRNGDTIELGSARLRFWLARGQQKTLRTRERITWAALFTLFAAQLFLIAWLLL